MEIKAGSTDQQIDVVAMGSSGHKTGLAAADFAIWYHRPGAAKVAISLSDKSAITDAHADGEIIEVGNGAYQLDLPDAALAAGVPQVVTGGTCTDGSVMVQPIDLIGQATTAATEDGLTGDGAYGGVLTIDDGSDPIEGARVRATLAGVAKAGTSSTDASGEITNWAFAAATYTITVTADGYQPTTTTLPVSGDGWTKTISLTALSITPSGSPDQCTGYGYVYDDDGNAEESVTVCIQMITAPSSNGAIYDGAIRSEASGADGLVEFTGLWIGAKYKYWRGDSEDTEKTTKTFTIDEDDVSGGVYALPPVVGHSSAA